MVFTLDKTKQNSFAHSGRRSGQIAWFRDERIAGKLMAIGVLPGSHIKLMRKAPFGGGWYVKVDNLMLALRQEELDSIVLNQE